MKIKNGNAILTTHRIIFYIDRSGLEIPLFNVGGQEKLGGLFATSGVKLTLMKQGVHSPSVIDYF